MKATVGCVVIWCLAMLSLSGQNTDLYTNVYVVPPTFLNPSSGEWRPTDPFADFTKPKPRKTAKEILMNAGISFSEGCSAIYNPSSSQLIVRNTQIQMQLVEAYIESLQSQVEKQIYLSFREIQIDQQEARDHAEVGFDWLLGPSRESALQTAGKSRSLDSHHSFLQELSRPPRVQTDEPSIARGIGGVFTEPQYQVLLRTIKKKLPKLEISTPPSVMVRSGQPALVQVKDQRYGAIAVLGADGFTVDLSIFLPEHGKALFEPGDGLSTPYQITIWDRQAVALTATKQDGSSRTVFVKAQIMDPAGQPINHNGGLAAANGAREAEHAEEAKEETGLSIEDQDNVKRADEFALQASQNLADGALRKAADLYDRALEILPSHEFMNDRREAYEKQSRRAKAGMTENDWIESLPKGSSYAIKEGETLSEITTRFGTSVAELKKLNRLQSDTVEIGQIILIPPGHLKVAHPSDPAEALKSVIIRSLDLDDATLSEALGLIHRVLLAETDAGLFPSPGPSIILKKAEKLKDVKITLRLSNVPASEALRYITSLAQCIYRVDGKTITISPLE